jgi:sRNA-binding protein
VRSILEANIEIEQDDPEVMKRMEYLATYLEAGDTLNIKAGGRVIKTTVVEIVKVRQ